MRGFVSVGGAPMLMTANGSVSILPVDYLNWSAPLTRLPLQATAANCGLREKRAQWPPPSSLRSAGRLCPRPALGLGLIRNSPAGIDARLPAPSGPFIVAMRASIGPSPGRLTATGKSRRCKRRIQFVKCPLLAQSRRANRADECPL